jgi:hypothetical protein
MEAKSFDVSEAVSYAIETIDKQDNPGPKIRPPKGISLKRFYRKAEQAFLDTMKKDIVEMSRSRYEPKSTGWIKAK